MLTYAFMITFVLGLTLGAVSSLYLAYRYFDRQDKAEQALLQEEAKKILSQEPIIHPSQR